MQSRMEFAYDIFNKNVQRAIPVSMCAWPFKEATFLLFLPLVVHDKGILSQKHFTQPVTFFSPLELKRVFGNVSLGHLQYMQVTSFMTD